MLKTLLAVATLGTLAMLPDAASAGGYGVPHATSSFSLRIVVQPAPRIVAQRHPRPWLLRPQPVVRVSQPRPIHHVWQPPVVRRVWYPSPRGGWHHSWRLPRQVEGWPHRRAPRPHGFGRSWHRPPHQVERWAHGPEPRRHGVERHSGAGHWAQGADHWRQGGDHWRQGGDHRARHGRGRH